MDNTPLAQRSPRLELGAIANAERKTVRAYRSKEVNSDSANSVDFVKDVSLYIIFLIFVICFVIICILYSTLFSLFPGKWALKFLS